jgi:general secretion pathway protein I
MPIRRISRAFSLLEVLLALAIFSIGLVGIMQATTVQVRAEKQAEDVTRATVLAQNIIEEIRYTGDIEADSDDGEFEGDDQGFAWEYQTEETEIAGLYRLEVAISWSDGMARKEFVAETYLAER